MDEYWVGGIAAPERHRRHLFQRDDGQLIR
jgi:hypothetical protein